MKILLLALLVAPFSISAQENHRPATEEEKKVLLPDEQASRMNQAAKNLHTKAVLNLLKQGMLGNALEQGLDDQQLKAYLQKLTDHGLDKTAIQQQVDELTGEYFARLQLKNLDKILPEDKKKKHEEKFQELQKQFEEKKITEAELNAAISALDQEISASPVTKENEKKQAELKARFNKVAADNTFVKKPLLLPAGTPSIQVMVPNNFSLKDYKSQDPLCLNLPTQNQGTQLEAYMKGINKELNDAGKPLFHEIYFAWGYNRNWHTKSDMTFTTADGTFTIHDAHGDDRPSPFDPKVYFNPASLSIPQYNMDIGVMFNPKWGLEASMNHMKWVFDNSRPYEMTGEYNRTVLINNPNPQYGWDLATPVSFTEAKQRKDASFLNAEHSDGYNYASVGLVYRANMFETKNKKFAIDARFGAGAGLMIPKTKVIFHQDQLYNFHGLDNKFHIAGGGVHADAGIKFTFFNSIFFQAVTRGTYIKVKDALVDGSEARLEHEQPIASVQVMGQLGYAYTFKNKKKTLPKN